MTLRIEKTGLLELLQLTSWFLSLSTEEQVLIHKYSGLGVNVNPDGLFKNGSTFGWSAVMHLMKYAECAASERNHSLAHKCIAEAQNRETNADQGTTLSALKDRTTLTLETTPDQQQINIAKKAILKHLSNNPGVLQSEIKKQFPQFEENVVGYAISDIRKENLILREKSGRSFKLFINIENQ